MRWGMPSSSQALFQATKKRADKLRAKGKEIGKEEFAELQNMEPDGGTTNPEYGEQALAAMLASTYSIPQAMWGMSARSIPSSANSRSERRSICSIALIYLRQARKFTRHVWQ